MTNHPKRYQKASLNQLGFSHLLVPLCIAIIVGLVGTYVLAVSHADQPQGPGSGLQQAFIKIPNGTVVKRGGSTYAVESANKSYSYRYNGAIDLFEVRSGDNWSGDPLNTDGTLMRNRSELVATKKLSFDQTWWGSFAFYLPASDTTTPDREVIIGQFHPTPDASDAQGPHPVLAFHLGVTNRYFISTTSDHNSTSTTLPEAITRYTAPSPLSRNVWHHTVYAVKFERTGNGSLTVYLDGTKVYNAVIPIGNNDLQPPYFKYGAYRPATTQDFIVEYANMEMGRASLQSRVTSPLPNPQ